MSGNGDVWLAVRNVMAKAWRRAVAAPKGAVRLERRARRVRQRAATIQAEWRIERDIAALARGRGAIVAGPWLSEVGFEVLYWIPFLRWFEDRYRVDRERVIAVSRGGVAEWYGDVAARYVEIFDHIDPATFARRNAERQERDESGGQKQRTAGTLDDELIAGARVAMGERDVTVCHPSLMYRLFQEFWFGNRAVGVVADHTRYVPLAVPRPDLHLPERYVAAKFYTGAALPDSPEHRRALRDLVAGMAERLPVVMLDTGLATDEHEDYLFGDIPNVTSLREHLTPRTNLGVQTRVIAGASAFAGTCGSLAWLAPMLGVDTIAVYADERFLLSHVYFARDVYRRLGAARFDTLDLRAAVQLDLLTGHAGVAVGSRDRSPGESLRS